MNKFLAMLFSVAMFVIAVDTTASTTRSLDDGLVAYYPFNGNANDESGHGNHGTVHGATLTEDRFGHVESAYSFRDNASDHMSFPASVINGLADFSFAAFVAIDYYNNSNNLISAARNGVDNAFIVQYNVIEDNGWKVYLNKVAYELPHNTAMNDMNWHFFVIVRERDVIKHFIDGELIGNGITIPLDVLNIDQNGFILGQEQDCVGGCFETNQGWEGKVDDLRIYNRALSDA